MKVAVLSESAADEAAIRIMVEGLLGRETLPVAPFALRSRGWPSVLQISRNVYWHLYYQTEAEALVLVVDSNHSPVHEEAHERPDHADQFCRLCQLRAAVVQVRARLHPVAGRPAIKVAMGMAVPAIEAWYLCGIHPHVNEATWIRGLQSGRYPFTKNQLKQTIYGTERPAIVLETLCATEAAHRLVGALPELEHLFPNGFGLFARTVRTWR
jgi:hypothetical protein